MRAAEADDHECEHARGADSGVAPVQPLVDLHADRPEIDVTGTAVALD